VGALDRMIKASTEWGLRLQPRSSQRAGDEYLYAAPRFRDQVSAIRDAGALLVQAGMAPSIGGGGIAVRRSAKSAAVTAPGADLGAIDNRHLTTVEVGDREFPALTGIRAGAETAVWAFPSSLLALAQSGVGIEPVSADLAILAGTVLFIDSLEDAGPGLSVIRGRGVVSGAEKVGQAVTRIQAAEALARMTIVAATLRRSNG
jgi:hypothetical protein